ncbi:MAG: cation-transporting P-type ATPase [Candidatus Kaiserbacteria bacterium]|nr:cation-transporting P-type ATPase [Candidatus Kaiserbacteria bacterium]
MEPVLRTGKDISSKAGHFSEHSESEVLGTLRTSLKGLTQREADMRLEKYGENTVQRKKHFIWLRRVVAQVKNPIVLILLLSSIVLYSIDYAADAYIILAVLIINMTIALLQEGKVSRAFDLLRKIDKQYALVLRDGNQIEVAANNLVPGDIVFFKAGSKISADIRILRENNLQVNESILTGEWAPVNKKVITLANKKMLAEQVNMAWKGTTVVTGNGSGVVVNTGERTAVGGIAKELYEEETKTPLQQQIEKLARWIMGIVFLAVVSIIIIGTLQGIEITELMITAIAVAIAGIPSGLPAAITVVLVLGMQSVLKNNGLVRNILAAETLGGTSWILMDKTGTLTNGNMVLSEILYVDQREEVADETISSFGRGIVHNAYLATDGKRLNREQSDGDTNSDETVFSGTAIEQSLVRACEAVCAETPHRDKRIAYVPFKAAKKYSCAITQEQSGEQYYYMIGAPEIVLEQSRRVHKQGKVVSLTDADRRKLQTMLAEEAGKGRRVIAIGSAKVESNTKNIPDDTARHQQIAEQGDHSVVFLALLSLEDTVRADVPDAIQQMRDSHVTLTMVTGDNQHTALHIAEKAGIIGADDSKGVLVGKEVEHMSDEELFAKAQVVRVFARMAPDQKSRLLRVLLDRKEVVAMTGDGVNDAPSLYRASIGIAVASGTDVAKEASDLILLKNSFSTITASIFEGKKIIRNLKKILIYLLSTSLSEAILVAGGLLATAMLPIHPIQILWANIIEEAFMAFAFAFEKGSSDIAKYDPRSDRTRDIISKNVKKTISILAIMTGLFLLGVYAWLTSFTELTHTQIQTVMFLTVSIDSVFMAISLKRLDRSIFATNLFNNIWLVGAVSISAVLMVLVFTVPPLTAALKVVPVPIWIFWLVPISALYHIIVVEVVKKIFFMKNYRTPGERLMP